MNKTQFDLIITTFCQSWGAATVAACRDVFLDGATAYAAERAHGCAKNTVRNSCQKIKRFADFGEQFMIANKCNDDQINLI